MQAVAADADAIAGVQVADVAALERRVLPSSRRTWTR
jgi:hypothetical protein